MHYETREKVTVGGNEFFLQLVKRLRELLCVVSNLNLSTEKGLYIPVSSPLCMFLACLVLIFYTEAQNRRPEGCQMGKLESSGPIRPELTPPGYPILRAWQLDVPAPS
jgi:hypothetical protein